MDPLAAIYTSELPFDADSVGNFPRAAKWNSDGSTILVQTEHGSFQCLNMAKGCLTGYPEHDWKDITHDHRQFLQPSPILDFAWYPGASSSDPASFCFVASVRECPVKLLDASNGRLRASYPIVDHCERHVAPHSLAFNLPANKLYCGFEDAIEVFDVHRPGEGTRVAMTPSKKSKDGLKGIVSALAFSPSYDLYAAGSLLPTTANIALFSESNGSTPMMYIGTEMAYRAGVTQVMFDPIRPHILYASFRRREAIYSWDLRGDVNHPVKMFHRTAERTSGSVFVNTNTRAMTNQKMRFDVDPGGHWLCAGDQEGDINMFVLDSDESTETDMDSGNTAQAEPSLKHRAHNDAIGSVSFHPRCLVLLSVSGSRHFPDYSSDSSGDDAQALEGIGLPSQPVSLDASIRMWRLGA